MIRWLLLCPYGELFTRILEGWVPIDDLGHTHGEWSVLCEWRGEGEPER